VATVSACRQLVGTLPELAKVKRLLLGSAEMGSAVLLLEAVERLGLPRPSELAADLAITESTVSRQLATLRRLEVVAVEPDRHDARSHRVGLTEKGVAELERQRRTLSARLAERLDQWRDDEVAELVALLDRFTHSVGMP
jgi:DNA-binding MarR family transcriptional regulator